MNHNHLSSRWLMQLSDNDLQIPTISTLALSWSLESASLAVVNALSTDVSPIDDL
jgi:hypothetical protein